MTDTTIANIALAQVGAERIGSLDDVTKGARVCSDMLPTIKNTVLEAADWGFATEYVTLTRQLTTPPGATASYQRTNNDIRAISVSLDGARFMGFGGRGLSNWRVRGRTIVTQMSSPPDTILVKYVDKGTPVGEYPSTIILCIATFLAAHLSLALKSSKTLYRDKTSEAKMLLEEAAGIDAVQGSDDFLVPGKLQQARLRLGVRGSE